MTQTTITGTTVAILALFFFFQAGICHAAGRLFILGIDESGSYVLRDQTMSIVKKFIVKEMEPGDTLYARRITDESYPDIPKNLLLPNAVRLPELDPEPKNRFDPSAKKKYIKAQRRINLIKKKMIVHIQNRKPLNAPKTDIYGFLAACADRLAYSRQYSGRKRGTLVLKHFDRSEILLILYTGTMPRQPRLDTPGALHHVMARGIERKRISRTNLTKRISSNGWPNCVIPKAWPFMHGSSCQIMHTFL